VTTTDEAERRDAPVERLFGATLGALGLFGGFGAADVLPIENDFFRFYRLRRS
jgi:hypothetical protein